MSVVHAALLEPESFVLGPKCGKPSAKLGKVIEAATKYRVAGETIESAIIKACYKCDYYKSNPKPHVVSILRAGYPYYKVAKGFDSTIMTVSDAEYDSCKQCIDNVTADKNIQKLLHPTNIWGDNLPSFNEDALFINMVAMYRDKAIILPIKLKIDNWTMDEEGKSLVLNDLKTSSKPCAWFMNEEYGSFYHYHYFRQFALYGDILKQWCSKEYGYSKKWDFKANVLVVNTKEFNTRVCHVTEEHLQKGREEYQKLIKMVAYYEMFGYDEEVEFI